jgi:two-component system phosphate regulon sensor histidine kinase PhoR
MRNPAKRIILILLLIVVLPALFYSGYEINSLGRSEEIIGQMYRRQLDAILSSVNQYSWDVAGNWASTFTVLYREHKLSPTVLSRNLNSLLEKYSACKAVFFQDSSLSSIESTAQSRLISEARAALDQNREKIDQLKQYRLLDYRKLEPIPLAASDSSQLLLAFTIGLPNEGQVVAGMVLDESTFVSEQLTPKLREAAGEDFILAVYDGDNPNPLFATEPVQDATLSQRKALWLFPQYAVGIALKGTTVDEILHRRFVRSLVLISLLDVVLLAGVVLVYRSIRKELELSRLKSDFVSNVSHELRTPLSLIRMFAETLEMGRLKDEQKKQEYYSTIVNETERLTRLVNNILNFSRMEAGRKRYEFHPVNVNAVVTDVLGTYQHHLQNEGFAVTTELGKDLPSVEGDREAISEALINLLDNAVKFSEKEKRLRLATYRENETVSLEVEDHGIGIAPEHQQKIFETFYRVSGGLVYTTKGSGLGLALVKQIMEVHGGKVLLESTPGKGSTFRLVFPLHRELGDRT